MANTLVDNVYIVDSALANVSLPWPTKGRIMAFAFWAANTTGEIIFTTADTTQVVARLTASNNPASISNLYIGGVDFGVMKVPTITAGTGWIYFG